MKANELMIGDWVRKLEPGGHTIPVKVTGIIDEDNSVLFERRDGVHGVTDIKAFEPLRLTSVFLNRNFPDVRRCIACYWNDSISTEDEAWYEVRTLDINNVELCVNIRYVHELQHALRLCGIEKEIEL